MTLEFYVYELRDEHGTVFYVGKGSKRRMYEHVYKARSGQQTHRAAKIRQILAASGNVVAVIVFRTTDEQAAFTEEKRLIAFYGRANLTNKTDGGDGTSNPPAEVREKLAAGRRGYKASEATRQLQSQAKLGKPRSRESVEKSAASRRGKPAPWSRAQALKNLATIPSAKGRVHRPDSIEKMRAAKMGHTVSQETRNKISQSKQGTPAWNKGKKAAPFSLAHRQAISRANTGHPVSLETRAKISATNKQTRKNRRNQS